MESTQTERLLAQATEIATRAFEKPSEAAVMKIFDRLAYEFDVADQERGRGEHVTH